MVTADVVVAGGGISGLLIATALGPHCSVVLLEQSDCLPQNKYWLTDEKALSENPQLSACVDRRYEFLDFVAYDGQKARVRGNYCLWDTSKLTNHLAQELSHQGVRVLTEHRLYSISEIRNGILVRANAEAFHARLLIDCMGFGSPLVGAKDIASIVGYYIMYGS
jgi:L-2-hydroxyglutarate oxidase LhgO